MIKSFKHEMEILISSSVKKVYCIYKVLHGLVVSHESTSLEHYSKEFSLLTIRCSCLYILNISILGLCTQVLETKNDINNISVLMNKIYNI